MWKKFGDDQAGNLAALIAYYAFVAIFPLLLVLVTVLNIVLKNDPGLQQPAAELRAGAVPGDRPAARQHIGPLHQTGLALVVGLLGTFIGARGVATAMQNALNSAWEIPFARRPGFPWSWLRSFGLIAGRRPGPDRDHDPVRRSPAGAGSRPGRRRRHACRPWRCRWC